MLDLSEGSSLAEPAADDLASLHAAVVADPGCSAFPALAESHRRAGRFADARRVAEEGLGVRPDDRDGQLALGLALLDLGELSAAREVLAGGLSLALSPMLNASAVGVYAAPQAWQSGAGESPLGEPDDLEIDRAFESAESDPDEMMDANRVAERVLDEEMRELAHEQATLHDPDEPPILDAAFADAPSASDPMDDVNRVRILATLETWLQNIRRPVV